MCDFLAVCLAKGKQNKEVGACLGKDEVTWALTHQLVVDKLV